MEPIVVEVEGGGSVTILVEWIEKHQAWAVRTQKSWVRGKGRLCTDNSGRPYYLENHEDAQRLAGLVEKYHTDKLPRFVFVECLDNGDRILQRTIDIIKGRNQDEYRLV